MGSDGHKGSEQIVQAGGEIIAQDEATSVVWGMPGAVVHHGLVSAVVPLNRVVDEIATRTARGRVARHGAGARR
jgi:two-component system chemotaxis response regulator CheB